VCRRGDEQLCRTPFSIGVFRSGGYADHLLVPHPRYLFDIGNIPPERAAPLACSGITTYGALKKVGSLLQEEPIVIVGAGGLGLMCLSLHKAMGGKGAIVVDIDPVKREAAKKAGAQTTVDGGAPDAAKQIVEATNGGASAVIDFVGARIARYKRPKYVEFVGAMPKTAAGAIDRAKVKETHGRV